MTESSKEMQIFHGPPEDVVIEISRTLWDSGCGQAVLDSLKRVYGELSERDEKIAAATWLATIGQCCLHGVFFEKDEMRS